MDKILTLTITETTDEGTRELHKGDYKGICILAEHPNEEGCAEILANLSMPTVSAMIASSKRVRLAAMVALSASMVEDVGSEMFTDSLAKEIADDIKGGLQ